LTQSWQPENLTIPSDALTVTVAGPLVLSLSMMSPDEPSPAFSRA
jgi:hypothetical protein